MTDSRHTISVIIPAYNIGVVIRRTLDSVLAQTLAPLEIIVVDDGSKDDTAEQVRSYGDKVRYIYQPNAGDGPARNTGIKAARGQWLAFLDHDDEWMPHKLETQLRLLRDNPALKWCETNFLQKYNDWQAPAGNEAAISRALNGHPAFDNYFNAHLHHLPSPISAVMMVHRTVFDQAGLFDSCWMRCADLDMWWRVAYHYPQLGYLAEPLSIMHLDVQHGLNTQLSLKDTRGRDACKLTERHLQLAEKAGMMPAFRPFIGQFIALKLRTTIFYGLGEDARHILNTYGHLLQPGYRRMARILTLFPRLSSALLRSISWLKHTFKLKKTVTRRYTRTQVVQAIQSDSSRTPQP